MKVTKAFVAMLPVIFITGCSLGLAEIEIGFYMMPISILMVFLILPVFCIERAVDMSLHPDKYAAKKAKCEADKAEARTKREAMKYARSIVEVKIIGGGSTVTTTHGLGGAIVGGALFGVPGAIVGSVIPKGSEQKVRFAVKYGSGKVEIQEHHPNSWEYKELMKHVKWEDLK